MQASYISYQETHRFSKLMADYLAQDKNLAPFIQAFPSLDNLQRQAQLKTNDFSAERRAVLYKELTAQYSQCSHTPATEKNITLLKDPNSVTITTGHQLCLMTGPLFFIYKIISTVKLCQQLNAKDDGKHYVPIYWMATEDHDFEEIQSFLFEGKKIQWNRPSGGAVGRMDLEGLTAVLEVFTTHLGTSKNATALKTLIKKSYGESNNLAEATRTLVNELFGSYGLLIIDGDSPALKKQFIPAIKEDLFQQSCFTEVTLQNQKIQDRYNTAFKPQVNPREINFFYFEGTGRYRIIKEGEAYQLDGHKRQFTVAELIEEVEQHPERFSPNVMLRPLYQETILPNICYIGGGGELAYWLELKSFFEDQKTLFPILLLRNSALLMNEKQEKRVHKLALSKSDLFLNRNALINKKIRQISNIDLDLSPFKQKLEAQFDHLESLIQKTDASFEGTVRAQKRKQFKGIEVLEKRLLKAQKKKLSDEVIRLTDLHQSLFPNNSLQERHDNFSFFYLALGTDFIPMLFKHLHPLSFEFTIIEY